MSKFKNFVLCFTIQCGRYGGIHIFEEHPSSTLTTEAVCFFEMLTPPYHAEDCHKARRPDINTTAVIISYFKYFNASYKNNHQIFEVDMQKRAMPC